MSGLRERVVNLHGNAGRGQPAHDVDDLGVANIGDVLLERHAKHGDDWIFAFAVVEGVQTLARDQGAHVVVDLASGETDMSVVAGLTGAISQVVWIDSDAVTADKAGLKILEIPFRSGRFQYIAGIDAEPAEYGRQLVHERDVEIPLSVLDHLRGLGDLDGS